MVHQCQPKCTTNADCDYGDGPPLVCNPQTSLCVGCLASTDCFRMVCNTTAHSCVNCVSDGDCTGNPSGSVCNAARECGCQTTADCPAGKTCNPPPCPPGTNCVSTFQCQQRCDKANQGGARRASSGREGKVVRLQREEPLATMVADKGVHQLPVEGHFDGRAARFDDVLVPLADGRRGEGRGGLQVVDGACSLGRGALPLG